jgi:AcrR family transcriptional regulator
MKTRETSSTTYHHGHLVEALLAAAIEIIEEKGVETLSVREVAKRVGVSPGAPFRHFNNKAALLTAVAEQAMSRLTESVMNRLAAAGNASPREALRAIGQGYLAWVLENPTHFMVISSRTLIDFHNSARLVEANEAIRAIMAELIDRGRADGSLAPGLPADDLIFAARAFTYGVARMWIDDHFREWKVQKPPERAMADALDLFVAIIGPTAPGEKRV